MAAGYIIVASDRTYYTHKYRIGFLYMVLYSPVEYKRVGIVRYGRPRGRKLRFLLRNVSGYPFSVDIVPEWVKIGDYELARQLNEKLRVENAEQKDH